MDVLRGRVVTPDAVLEDGVVVVEGDRLAWVGPVGPEVPRRLRDVVEAATPGAGVLLPGLVDLHCHGGAGASFPDGATVEELRRAVLEHRRHGTTSLVASLVTATPAALRRQVALLADLAEVGDVEGIHLEGPFLSVARCGAQDPGLILPPDAALTEELLRLGRGHVVTMTLAPELPGSTGAEGVLGRLVARGAVPSWGHTDAGPAAMRRALEESARLLGSDPRARSGRPTATHLFNGMRPWAHRDPGPVGELLAAARRGAAVLELVADGIHLAPEVVREVYEIVGRDALVLVTDAMAAAGMPDGRYRLGSQEVDVVEGVARLTAGGSIAGGTSHLVDVVRSTVDAGVPMVDAVAMASLVPARVLGLGDRGGLVTGWRADVLLVDDGLRPVRVLRAGAAVPST